MKKFISSVSVAVLSFSISGCGTLTGIPAHGGGKRFATEQKLVSASARAALKQIDVSPLMGRKVFVLYTVINDQGAGSMNGGRMTLAGLLQTAAAVAPTTATANKFQVFDLQGS